MRALWQLRLAGDHQFGKQSWVMLQTWFSSRELKKLLTEIGVLDFAQQLLALFLVFLEAELINEF